MQDRVSLYPGRVKLVPVSGQANTYDMVRADSPTQEGTPLNKASMLKDSTASLYGLPNTAVPDDVLSWISFLNKYYWRRKTFSDKYVVNESEDERGIPITTTSSSSARKVYYADSYTFNSEKSTFTLVDYQFVSIYPSQASVSSLINIIGNKYVLPEGLSGSFGDLPVDKEFIFHTGSNLNIINPSGSDTWYYCKPAKKLKGKRQIEDGEWQILSSYNKDEFPKTGLYNEMLYDFLGSPVNRAATNTRIQTGKYVGTGTSGEANKNSLTFDIVPSIIVIYGEWGSNASVGYTVPVVIVPYAGMDKFGFISRSGNTAGYVECNCKFEGNSISWWGNNAINQGNMQNRQYNYVAIG